MGMTQGIGGLWRSLVARFVWDEDVAGSNPVSPTNYGQGPVEAGSCVVMQQVCSVVGRPVRPCRSAYRRAALSMDRGLRLVAEYL